MGSPGTSPSETAEGIARMIADMLKDAFKSGPIAMLGAALALPDDVASGAKTASGAGPTAACFWVSTASWSKAMAARTMLASPRRSEVAASMGESSFLAEVAEHLRRLGAGCSCSARRTGRALDIPLRAGQIDEAMIRPSSYQLFAASAATFQRGADQRSIRRRWSTPRTSGSPRAPAFANATSPPRARRRQDLGTIAARRAPRRCWPDG